jgi:hypothetical protein
VNIWNRLTRAFRTRTDEQKQSHSLVLLLRKSRFISKAEVQKAAEAGWNKCFDGQEDPMYFVVQRGTITMIKAGIYVVHLVQADQPYLGDPEQVAQQLPRGEQKVAWRQHNAWVSFDMLNLDAKREDAYAALAKFALQLGDENCAGVYLPNLEIFMPNDGSAEEGMRMLVRKELPFG